MGHPAQAQEVLMCQLPTLRTWALCWLWRMSPGRCGKLAAPQLLWRCRQRR